MRRANTLWSRAIQIICLRYIDCNTLKVIWCLKKYIISVWVSLFWPLLLQSCMGAGSKQHIFIFHSSFQNIAGRSPKAIISYYSCVLLKWSINSSKRIAVYLSPSVNRADTALRVPRQYWRCIRKGQVWELSTHSMLDLCCFPRTLLRLSQFLITFMAYTSDTVDVTYHRGKFAHLDV